MSDIQMKPQSLRFSDLVKRFAVVGLVTYTLSACGDPVDLPPVESEQIGFRGTAMEQVNNPRREALERAAVEVPEPLYPPEEPGGERAGDIYENVQVLGDLNDLQFNRVMAHITEWVAPVEEGCAYCHNVENMADDSVYTKVVARKMLQMTIDINSNWTKHVGNVGVTCYTCHRGNALPANYWFNPEPPKTSSVGATSAQNRASPDLNMSSLPMPYTQYLLGDQNIRYLSNQALPTGEKVSDQNLGIKGTEQTYALMIHMSQSLGVNCTYCHNSRAFGSWAQSPPQRGTAWYGIRMARNINNEYMVPLTSVFPANKEGRLGPTGDVGKVNCTTCHAGANKPLYGAKMLKDHPELWGTGDYTPQESAAISSPVGEKVATAKASNDE